MPKAISSAIIILIKARTLAKLLSSKMGASLMLLREECRSELMMTSRSSEISSMLVQDTMHLWASPLDTLLLRVSEDGWREHPDAQFILKVDGVQVGEVNTVTASHGAGQTKRHTYRAFP